MMLRYEIHNKKCPPFESKKSLKYCEDIYKILNNEDELLKKLNNIILKINSLNVNLNNNEISKSKDFVKKCLEIYTK